MTADIERLYATGEPGTPEPSPLFSQPPQQPPRPTSVGLPPDGMDFDDLLTHATEVALEAYRQGMEAAVAAASTAFQGAMPALDSLPNIRAYIASVARGMDEGWLPPPEAKQMLRIAERALAAQGTAR